MNRPEAPVPCQEEHPTSPPLDNFFLARQLKTPVWVYDIDNNRITHANSAACDVWEAKSEKTLRHRDLSSDRSPAVTKRLLQYQADFQHSKIRFREAWTLYPNGLPRTLDMSFSGFVYPDGRMGMLCEAMGGGSEVEDIPENLRSAEALLHTDVIIALFGLNGEPLYMNPAARGAMPAGANNFKDMFLDPKDFLAIEKSCETQGLCRRVAKIATAASVRWLDFSVKYCQDAATGDHALLVTAVDVTALKTARDKAKYLADRDQLTDCFNRTYLRQYLDQLSDDFEMTSGHHAVVILDVDHFKQLNDTYGHDFGDRVLIRLVDELRRRVGRADIISRLGGDEFLIFLEGLNSEHHLAQLLSGLSMKVQVPMNEGPRKLDVTLSLGASLFEITAGMNWNAKIQEADIALYHSKKTGRNRYTIYNDELDAGIIERKWLEAEIGNAISGNAFAVHYQPRINLSSGKIVGAEALIRWNHPDCGFISPEDFIPICEEIGVINEIGAFVFRRVCEDLNQWHERGFDLNISINVSPIQFQHDIVKRFEDIINSATFPNSCIELELTETSLAGDNAEVQSKIQAMTDMGFGLALDDFGTGYSNLAYISAFPVQCIKLDRTFVQKLPDSGPLLKLIFALANQIGADTVAEGVETAEQLKWLRRHKCDEVQGFYLHRPMPADEFSKLLTEEIISEDLRKTG